ncbi:hypothetical protein TGPRC2_226565 [Toxoplasma gondii TgCatPRC2]|uniref:Uncharacterized protein n=1 Tax=Toxoplasma gondii TgCatPRC2 TaxID=1130821 RepID=A0A151HIW6_TOXGO|nr:hypothetical protein TGPRC2_226565 [Toxoplasma gondii TgCatPRC2]
MIPEYNAPGRNLLFRGAPHCSWTRPLFRHACLSKCMKQCVLVENGGAALCLRFSHPVHIWKAYHLQQNASALPRFAAEQLDSESLSFADVQLTIEHAKQGKHLSTLFPVTLLSVLFLRSSIIHLVRFKRD